MNIKDYTLKLGYRVSGKRKEESVEYSLVKNGYEGEDIVLRDDGDENHVKIVLSAKGDVQIDLAELIYDHYFENNERFFANGFQSWTSTREYKRRDVQYGLRSLSKLPLVRKFSGASGDYAFTEYGKDLYHSFSYTYFRKHEKVEFFGSLNERTGYEGKRVRRPKGRRGIVFDGRIRVVRYRAHSRNVR